jgi:4-hydroxybenzoate polyprenyltransferase
MKDKLIPFIFFGNYFLGLLTIALSLETALQLHIPFNSISYYGLTFVLTILYYTYAYKDASGNKATTNPRIIWYRKHAAFIKYSQFTLLIIASALGLGMLYQHAKGIQELPLSYWLVFIFILLAGLSYYGLIPGKFLKLNLRQTGLLKAFVIGFVWACWVNLAPVIALRAEKQIVVTDMGLLLFLFIKNWMFCTANAIMFDIKDYADDSNRQLKTFVVRFGLRKTIFYTLFPLLIVCIISALTFAHYRHFKPQTMIFNMIPFVSLLIVAYSLHNRKPILYYLIVIDGLLLIKACCGIAGVLVAK